ncbi:ATP-dependent DNA helicase [Pseudonocardia zijingensis]|uniref:TrwC relaxase n=1 Tax=Pseudonocardia zijingensis TaxID=153376 RepID=A0ABN1N8M7_9PSEU
MIDRALDAVGEHQQTWTRSDLMWAISNALPADLGVDAGEERQLLDQLTDRALAEAIPTKPEEDTADLPDEFRLANGKSSYQAPGSAKYTAPGQVTAERIMRESAVRTGAATITLGQANAVIARYAENGVELGADQKAAVHGVCTSGAFVEVLAAAAGTGKSVTVGAIAEAWAADGRRTVGLAPSQVAADVLAEERVTTWNLARWRGAQQRLDEGRAQDDDEQLRLRAGDLVVVDEAGMAATEDLAEVARRCEKAGAKMLLVGDQRQLAAVGPGGAMADLGARAASYELTEVRRFRVPWEGEASLRLRDGDRVAIEQYDKHGRLHEAGTPEEAEQAAERAWLADTIAGRTALLLVGSNEQAARASARLRAELVRLGRVSEQGVALGRDGTTAGVGDLVQARRNAWGLRGWEGNERVPINRETYRVVGVRDDGGLQVAKVIGRTDTGGDELAAPIALPRDYVDQHLSLAYASTVHAAQGRTVDTSHTVVAPSSDAASVYVGLTRGREGNDAWIVTRPLPSDAPVGAAQEVEPRPGRAVLEEVLERAEDQRGALAEQEQAAEDAASVRTNIDRLVDGISTLTAGRWSGLFDRLAAAGTITEEQRRELAADRAMGSVERLLRLAEVAGHDPGDALRQVLEGKTLAGANSPAQVLHKRLRDSLGELGAKISSFRDLIPAAVPEKARGYLERLADSGDDRRRELGARVAAEAPRWAVETLGAVPEDPVARAEWEHRAGWAAADRELDDYDSDVYPLGPAPPPGLPEKRAVWWTAHDELGLPDVGPEEESLSDGRLRTRVAAYMRERIWAPRYVADELAATNDAAAARRADAELWAAHADTLTDPGEAQRLRDDAAAARAEAEQLVERAAQLEEADKARARWYAHTAVTRERALRAKATLERRGIDVERPADETTAREWLAAERAAREREDAHRPIHDTDLAAEETVDAAPAPGDGPVVETAVLDIRDVAVPDETEFADADPRRRVPEQHETTVAVARAQEAVAEIDARHDADRTGEADIEAEQIAWWATAGEHDPDSDDADEHVMSGG